mmetsp:Transcript_55897/g.144216  ORF Transcript_55897/g.144216 Transcript_55897/m.144216 type:complete len:264 (-) Transcript_55897:345-1136(-)
MQLCELLGRDAGRRVHHRVSTLVVFWESDVVANGGFPSQNGAEPIQAEGQAAVRRRPVLEGAEEETELILGLFLAHAQHREHLHLKVPVVNPDRATADLDTIDHHVVCIGPDLSQARVLLVQADHPLNVFCPRRSERVVLGVKATAVLVPLEHREVHHPQRFEATGSQSQLCTHQVAELAHCLLGLQLRARKDAEQIARLASSRLSIRFLDPDLVLLVREEFLCGAIEASIVQVFHPDEGAGSRLLARSRLLQFLQLFARPLC